MFLSRPERRMLLKMFREFERHNLDTLVDDIQMFRDVRGSLIKSLKRGGKKNKTITRNKNDYLRRKRNISGRGKVSNH